MQMTCKLPDHALVVEALLEGFVLACQVCIEAGLAPMDPRDSRVIYKQEPPGEEDWKLPQNVVRDGWGDCEDLAGWRAAGLRLTGEDAGARVVVVTTGRHKLHAVVQRSDGSIDDPSKELRQRQTMLGIEPTPPPGVVYNRRGSERQREMWHAKNANPAAHARNAESVKVLRRTTADTPRAVEARERRAAQVEEQKQYEADQKQAELDRKQQEADDREYQRQLVLDQREAQRYAQQNPYAYSPGLPYSASTPFQASSTAQAYSDAYGFNPYAEDIIEYEYQEEDEDL